MIERQLVKEKIKEFQIQEYIQKRMGGADLSHASIKKTPLGDKIVIYSAKPGLVVGRKGENIRALTETMKKEFKLENPQIEISEVDNIYLDANVVAERIVSGLQIFGSMRFKQIGHRMVENVINAGARGVEITLSGKLPSERARRWRFYKGYLKKSGEAANEGVSQSIRGAKLKAGVVGVVVRIMPPDVRLPDQIILRKSAEEKTEEGKEVKEEKVEGAVKTEEKKEDKTKKKAAKKKGTRKKKAKKEEDNAEEPAEEKAAEEPKEEKSEEIKEETKQEK